MGKNKIVFVWFIVILTLSGCSSQVSLLDNPINPDDITQIQIVLAMGNPEYGALSKIITDRNEIEALTNAFNELTIGDQVDVDDVYVTLASDYYFFTVAPDEDETDEIITYHFSFNGNDTERIWINKNWYRVSYIGQTPFELYQVSSAIEIRVDENRIEIQQP